MSAINTGTAYLYATAITPSLTPNGGSSATLAALVTGFTPTSNFATTNEEKNMAGVTVTRRYNDRTYSANVDFLLEASASVKPAIGDKLVFSSMSDSNWDGAYIIETVSSPITRGNHVQYTAGIKRSEGITVS